MRISDYRGEVINLRLKGYTYSEINKKLVTSYPKSTMSGWCKGLKLPDRSKERLLKLSRQRLQDYRQKAVIANRLILEKRQAIAKNKAQGVVGQIKNNKDALKFGLAMLHWGEGAKSRSFRGLSMGNSDPKLLNMYMSMLETCYGIDRNNFKARIICRDDQDKDRLTKYWSDQLNIHPGRFYKVYVDKRTVGKPTSKEYMGVCTLICAGTDIQLELEQIAENLYLNSNDIL